MQSATGAYERQYRDFRWNLPAKFNIAWAVCDRWAARDPHRTALVAWTGEAQPTRISFGDLAQRSNKLANALRASGISPGDRIALLMPQSVEAVVAHLAAYKIGAIAVPLAMLFGVEALEHRLQTASARVVITNEAGYRKVSRIADRLTQLELVITVDGEVGNSVGLSRFIEGRSEAFTLAETGPDDPALMIFTSGTTGPPKGALHGHRVLLGHLPGIVMHHDGFPQRGDLMWTPADWAWAGGLLNALLPALYFGVPVAFGRFERFDPDTAAELVAACGVRNAFIPPTALRMLKAAGAAAQRLASGLRTIGSAGEALGRETFEWARSSLPVPVNEFYGQTECNIVLSSAAQIGVARAGAIGKAVPGHRVAIIDGEGNEMPQGTLGQIAVARPDPVMFLGYWENEAATAAKSVGEWMTTGDQGVMDEDGYFFFVGRDDDVITSAGYRIGPGEVEDCLTGHPAVALAAAVGKPDALRTEIVKAFVVLRDGVVPSDALKREIQLWVRERLSAHEYPREVEFVDSIPLTTSGKVIRRMFREQARRESGLY